MRRKKSTDKEIKEELSYKRKETEDVTSTANGSLIKENPEG